jgi:hypothetical protein
MSNSTHATGGEVDRAADVGLVCLCTSLAWGGVAILVFGVDPLGSLAVTVATFGTLVGIHAGVAR